MKRDIIIIGVATLGLVACEKTELRETTQDRYLPQPVDTVKVTDNYYLDGYSACTATALGEGRTLNAANLLLDGAELYVANFAGKCVDVFDAESLKYKRSMANGERTLARDVYVEGDHVFVAAGDSREVQIFDRKTGAYLSRLGTGNWQGSNVSWAGCVCATKRFAFVRDSKETNVRVFDREALDLKAANNNTVFARLATGGNFIGGRDEPTTESYDMEVIGDSLYAFVPRTGVVYAWNVSEIADKKDKTPVSVTTPGGVKIRSVARGKDDATLFVAMQKNGNTLLVEMTVADFQSRNFGASLRQFAADSRVTLPSQPIIAYVNERLVMTNGDKLERWEIRNNPSYIIQPKKTQP